MQKSEGQLDSSGRLSQLLQELPNENHTKYYKVSIMRRFFVSLCFVLGASFFLDAKSYGFEFAMKNESKSKYYLLDPNSSSKKQFYYLIKNKDKYTVTKNRIVEFVSPKIENFQLFKNTVLQSPKKEK